MNTPILIKVKRIYAIYKQIFKFLISLILLIGIFLSPSQFKIFFLAGWAIISITMIYSYFYYRLMKFRVYEDRLEVKKGVFSAKVDFVELYRVKDYQMYQSFFMRIFKIMNITLITSDRTTPIIRIFGINKSNMLDTIRFKVEEQRKLKGVREFD